MTVTTTLLSSTSLANEASTPLDPAKIQRPDSTASVILEGNNKKKSKIYMMFGWIKMKFKKENVL